MIMLPKPDFPSDEFGQAVYAAFGRAIAETLAAGGPCSIWSAASTLWNCPTTGNLAATFVDAEKCVAAETATTHHAPIHPGETYPPPPSGVGLIAVF